MATLQAVARAKAWAGVIEAATGERPAVQYGDTITIVLTQRQRAMVTQYVREALSTKPGGPREIEFEGLAAAVGAPMARVAAPYAAGLFAAGLGVGVVAALYVGRKGSR